MDPSDGNDPMKYFSRSYDNYNKLSGKLARMMATRTMLLAAAFQQSSGRYLSTSHVLMRAHFEVGVGGGEGGQEGPVHKPCAAMGAL